jgi:hypothetical protein
LTTLHQETALVSSTLKFGSGQAVERLEDAQLLQGKGVYTDDVNLPEQTRLCFVRSPYPHARIASIDTSAAERASIRQSLGLDDPVLVQFGHYFINAVQFKFGVSYQFRLPVSSLLAERLPATLELAICATLFAMAAGILMGVYSARGDPCWTTTRLARSCDRISEGSHAKVSNRRASRARSASLRVDSERPLISRARRTETM